MKYENKRYMIDFSAPLPPCPLAPLSPYRLLGVNFNVFHTKTIFRAILKLYLQSD